MVDCGISNQYMTPILSHMARFRGSSSVIRKNQKPEFGGRACAGRMGISNCYAPEAGSSALRTQSANLERFNGKFRDECYARELVPLAGQAVFKRVRKLRKESKLPARYRLGGLDGRGNTKGGI